MSEPEAAYHVCLHVGFLDRSTGDSKVVGGLLGLDPSDRVRLILAAAAYLGGLSVIRTLRQLVESDVLEPEQIEQAADLMLARDGAEEVLRVLRDLAKNLPAEHCDGVLAALARAEIVTAEIDDLFESRPDVLSVLAPFMSGVRDRIVTTIDPIRQWWFSRLDASETQLDAVTPNDLLPVAEVASAARPSDSAPTIALADPAQAPACYVAWEQSRALAASSGSTTYVQPFQVSCSEEPGLRGTMLVLPAHVYQFLLQRVAGAEKSRAGDGDYVAAYADREELARAELRDGHAVLQAGRMPTEFRLILRDDRCWTLRLDALEGIPG